MSESSAAVVEIPVRGLSEVDEMSPVSLLKVTLDFCGEDRNGG